MPVLLVTLQHQDDTAWDYAALERIELSKVTLAVAVKGLKTVMLSNDHGPDRRLEAVPRLRLDPDSPAARW